MSGTAASITSGHMSNDKRASSDRQSLARSRPRGTISQYGSRQHLPTRLYCDTRVAAANQPMRGIAMKFTAFLLDQWLQQHAGAEFKLGGSTGPRWTPRQVLALAGDSAAEKILDLDLDYTPTPGASSLREAIAAMQGVPAEDVFVFAGSAEALFHIFYLAAQPGANAVVPFPCFPSHQVIPESLGFEIRRYHLTRENSYRVDLNEVRGLADGK